MNNNPAVKKVCQNGAYRFRPETDSLFCLPHGSFRYSGVIDGTIRQVERMQLLKPETWSLFVNQFRSCPDDEKLAWRCEYWGKMMRGACFTYEYTQNAELYAVLCETVKDLLTTQDELGRITTYSVEREFDGWDLWGRKYVLLGLQYFLDICSESDSGLRESVISAMCSHAGYIMDHVGKGEGKRDITLCTRNWLGLNSCSILEPFVRLYNLTDDKRYIDYSKYIVETGCLSEGNIFDLALEGKIYPCDYPANKAYEMMSCFEGAIEYYRVTKEEKYRKAAENFSRLVLEAEISLIGSAGCTHELFDFAAKRQSTTEYNGIMQETCVTVTWMKFCFQLLSLTGNSIYADAIERSMYNAMLGSVNSYETANLLGFPFDSYSPLFMGLRSRSTGGCQVMENGTSYGCCACIGAAGTGLMAVSSAMTREDGISVNLYIPGIVDFYTPKGTHARILSDTYYPTSGSVKLTLSGVHGDENFAVAVRIPGWCKKYEICLDGKTLSKEIGGFTLMNGYAVINRAWSWGDTVELLFDMPLHVVKPPFCGSDKNSACLAALEKGPLVFARDARLGEKIDSVVDIVCDENGNVPEISSSSADFPTMAEYKIPMRDGSFITVVDYQSAGKTWDENSLMTMWMPTKLFGRADLSKEFIISVPRTGGTDIVLGINRKTYLVTAASEETVPEKWRLEECGEYVRIVSSDGRCLCAEERAGELPAVKAAAYDVSGINGLWKIRNTVMRRFRLFNVGLGLNACFELVWGKNEVVLCGLSENRSFNGASYANNAFFDFINV